MAPAGEDLIARMVQRDTEALARFYDRYSPLAFSLILRIVRDRTDASEVLQDVFWEAWETAGAYDPARGTPEAWVAMRARARAIDRVRSLRRRHEMFVAPVNETVTPEAGAAARSRGVGRAARCGAVGARPAVRCPARGH